MMANLIENLVDNDFFFLNIFILYLPNSLGKYILVTDLPKYIRFYYLDTIFSP